MKNLGPQKKKLIELTDDQLDLVSGCDGITVAKCIQDGLTNSTIMQGSNNTLYSYPDGTACPANGSALPDGYTASQPNYSYSLDGGDGF